MRSTSREPRGGTPSGRLLDVELVEDSGVAPSVDGAVPHGPARPELRAVRLVRRWWRPVAIGLAVALLAASVISDRRQAARLAAFADVDGVVAPLDGPPHAGWSTTAGLWSTPIETAGRIVYATQRADGGTDVIAFDVGTGTEDWRTPLGTPVSDTTASLTSTCVAVTASSGPSQHLVACLAGLFLFNGSGTDTPTTTWTSTHLELIDAVSGKVVEDTPTARATSIGRLGTDLVRADVTADGRLRVERTDPLSTTPRWTFTSPATTSAVDTSSLRISVVAERVLVLDGSTAWSVLSADGTLIRSSDQAVASGRISGFTGTQLFTESPASTVDAPQTEVLDLDTGRAFTVEGYSAGPVPDDRSVPDIVLTQTKNALLASDATTGKLRWSTSLGSDGRVMVIDGRVVVDDPTSLRAIDGRSGRVLWERRGAAPVNHSAVTDATKPDGTTGMTAYGLDDGLPRWTAALPPGTGGIAALGRRLVTATTNSMTVWR
jgi:outer membrane protein assembly factor BamB